MAHELLGIWGCLVDRNEIVEELTLSNCLPSPQGILPYASCQNWPCPIVCATHRLRQRLDLKRCDSSIPGLESPEAKVTMRPSSRDRDRQQPANHHSGSQNCYEVVGAPNCNHQYPMLEHQLQQQQYHNPQQPIHDHSGFYSNRNAWTNASLHHSDVSASTFDSGRTHLLARQRLITPDVLTPTSSEVSCKGYEDNTGYSRATFPERRAEQHATANCKFTTLLVVVCTDFASFEPNQ